MKKYSALLCALTVWCGMTACGNSEENGSDRVETTANVVEATALKTTTTATKATTKITSTTATAEDDSGSSVTYHIGADAPSGEYIFKPNSEEDAFVFVKSTAEEDAEVIGLFTGFDSQVYLELRYGQCVTVVSADMQMVNSDTRGKNVGAGCFRAGIDIPAGKYRITADGEYPAYCISNDSFPQTFHILTGDFISFENEYDVVVEKGEYLYLKDANLEAKIG